MSLSVKLIGLLSWNMACVESISWEEFDRPLEDCLKEKSAKKFDEGNLETKMCTQSLTIERELLYCILGTSYLHV